MDNTRRNNHKRFHDYPGSEIVLSENNTVAHRTSHERAEIFSDRPLHPGELFLIEIEEVQRIGWVGHMRIGVTRRDPNKLHGASGQESSKSYSTILRTDWTVGVSDLNIYEAKMNFHRLLYNKKPVKKLEQTKSSIKTCRGIIPRNQLKSKSVAQNCELDGSDVGSRIGVMFIPTSETEADLHVIVNGKDEGPLAAHIPYSEAPLYVMIELRGSTRKIRIVELSYVAPTLKMASKEYIMERIPASKVNLLPIPKEVKKFLIM